LVVSQFGMHQISSGIKRSGKEIRIHKITFKFVRTNALNNTKCMDIKFGNVKCQWSLKSVNI
jgi:hypothetical protein